MKQTDLFDPRAPFQRHSETSREAAKKIEPALGPLQAKVLAYLRVLDGATDEEMQRDLALNPSTQRPRRIELVEKGLVMDSGRKAKTASGRLATIWRVR